MKKAMYCLLVSVLFLKCKPDFPNSKQIFVYAKFTDFKGVQVKESSSGEAFIIRSDEFSKIDPNGINPNLAKLYFNNVEVPFQVVGPNSISTKMPIMLLTYYTNITINIKSC